MRGGLGASSSVGGCHAYLDLSSEFRRIREHPRRRFAPKPYFLKGVSADRNRCSHCRRYRVRFHMLTGTEHECSGAFLEIARLDLVILSFRLRGGRPDTAESRVEVAL